MSLRSAEAHARRQRRLVLLLLAAIRRAFTTNNPELAVRSLAVVQHQAATEGALSVRQMLAEQRIDVPGAATVDTARIAESVGDIRGLRLVVDDLFYEDDRDRLERFAHTQAADAARVGAGVEIAQRQGVMWVRMVNPPCCARCAILAGETYRWSDGFERHPRCDCTHIPTTENRAGDVRTDPEALFDSGQIRGLSKADGQAIRDGADLAQVVNIRRSEAGLTVAGRVLRRGGRPTPEAIYQAAKDDRDEAIRLLREFGYIR